MLRRIVLASVGAIALTAAANAADMYVPAPAEPVSYKDEVPAANWTGFYLGGDVGARWSSVDGTVTSVSDQPSPPNNLSIKPNGSLDSTAFRGGFFAGWNWQFAPKLVVGLEGDAHWDDNNARVTGSPYPQLISFGNNPFPGPFPFGGSPRDSFSVHSDWDSSVRLRGGYLLTPATMLFATGGVSFTHLGATSNCSTVNTGGVGNCAPGNYFNGTLNPAVISHSESLTGWTVGAGVETMITPHWTVRLEYRHEDFGTVSFTDVRCCSGAPQAGNPLSISYALRMGTDSATVGVAYKLGAIYEPLK